MPNPLQIWGANCVFYAEFGDASSLSLVDGLTAAFTDKATGTIYTQPTVGSRFVYQPTGYGGGGAILMASGKTFTFPQPANFPSGNQPHTIIIVGRYTASNAYPTPFAYGAREVRRFRSMSARNRRVNAGFFGDDHESTGLGWANVERVVVSMVDGASPVTSWLLNAPNSSESKTLGGPLNTPTTSTVEINRVTDTFDGPVRAIIVLNRMATTSELSDNQAYFSQPYSTGGGVTPSNAAGGQTATAPSLVARSIVQTVDASQASSATSAAIAARGTAQPDTAAQASAASSPTLTPSGMAAVNSAPQPSASTSPTLAPRSSAAVDSAGQTSAASSPTVASRASVTAGDAAQGQAASSPQVAPAGSVMPGNAAQASALTGPALSSRSTVAPASVVQSSTTSSPTVAATGSVSVDSAQQANTGSSAPVHSRAAVVPASAAQPQAFTSPQIAAKASLSINSASQAQSVVSPILFVGARPLPPSPRTVRSPRVNRIVSSRRPTRIAA